MIPPKPGAWGPEIPPPGFEDQRVKQWRDRPKIAPRLQLVHTNGASREGSIESSKSWAERGGGNTIPHCQIDRSGRGAMLLPSDRKGIANYRAADFSLGFETADTGYLDDPAISAFTDKQAESVAVACAYYAVLHGIPLTFPKAWDGSGTGSHTEPFGYPDWTNAKGKICPGIKKKAQVRDLILPRAREIAAAWSGTQPAPKPQPSPTPGGYIVPDIYVPNEIIKDAPPSVNGKPSDPVWLWATAYQQWQIERPGTIADPPHSGLTRLIQWGTNNAIDAGMIPGPKVRTDGVYDQATAEGWNRWLNRAG